MNFIEAIKTATIQAKGVLNQANIIDIITAIIVIIMLILICKRIYNNYKIYGINEALRSYDSIFLDQWSENFYGFPFQGLRTSSNRRLKIAVLSAPLYKDERAKFHKLKQDGYLMVGISSYGFYPFNNEEDFKHDSRSEALKDPEMQDILKDIDCWLTCSHTPVPFNIPQMVFSESDCPNIDALKPKGLPKKYDVIYNAGSDLEFHQYHKNWPLAKKCITKFDKMGLKILIIGRNKTDELDLPNIDWEPFLNWYEFIDKIEQAKVLFVPNVSDASPRIITEALCKGTAVLVNKEIFCGWKYVNEHTGDFFTDENDAYDKLDAMLKSEYDTRNWFINNNFENGKCIKRKELGEFILEVYNKKNQNK